MSTISINKEIGFDFILKAVGKVVQGKRHGMGISQEELARRSNVHRTYISDVERGSRSVSLVTLCKLAEALNTNASTMVLMAESACVDEQAGGPAMIMEPPSSFSVINH